MTARVGIWTIIIGLLVTMLAGTVSASEPEPYRAWAFDVRRANDKNNLNALTALAAAKPDFARVWFYGQIYDLVNPRVPEAERTVREGRWSTWSLGMLTGLELREATLGIVGLGRIGAAVARRARAFGMHVVYAGRRAATASLEAELQARHLPLDELLATSDVVSLHAPLTEETHHLLSRERLFAMKPGALLVNTARGALVDEASLADALENGPLRFAALDVFANEPRVHPTLLQRDDVLLLPHIGSATQATRYRMASLAVDAVLDAAAGRPLAHRAV